MDFSVYNFANHETIGSIIEKLKKLDPDTVVHCKADSEAVKIKTGEIVVKTSIFLNFERVHEDGQNRYLM